MKCKLHVRIHANLSQRIIFRYALNSSLFQMEVENAEKPKYFFLMQLNHPEKHKNSANEE